MKLALCLAVSIALLGALAPAARADDDAAAIATAGAFWAVVSEWAAPPASKKAPIAYAIKTTTKQCKKLKVGKATSAKAAEKLASCVTNAVIRLIPAEIDYTPRGDGWTTAMDSGEFGFDKKQKKAIKAMSKGAIVVTNTFYSPDDEETVTVYVAVAGDKVRGLWIQTKYFDD